MWIVLAIQLIPCRNENGLCCFGRQVLLLLGCSLTPVCWFLRRRRIGWFALPTPSPARGRDRPPSGGTGTIGILPVVGYSDDTLVILVRRDAEPTCRFLARSALRVGRLPFLEGELHLHLLSVRLGICLILFVRWRGLWTVSFLRLLSCWRWRRFPGPRLLQNGEAGQKWRRQRRWDVSYSSQLKLHVVVEVELKGSRA